MFLKATTPTVRDTVKVADVDGNEITRFVAVWKRPDSDAREALLKAQMEGLQALQAAQQAIRDADPAYGMNDFSAAMTSIKDGGKARIREYLCSVEGLLDANDQPVEYAPAVLDTLLKWAEYTNPLAESLARLASGHAVLEAQAKNAETPDVGGQPSAPVAMAA